MIADKKCYPLVRYTLTPLKMVQDSIAEHEAALKRLREKEHIALRWALQDAIWEVTKPR